VLVIAGKMALAVMHRIQMVRQTAHEADYAIFEAM